MNVETITIVSRGPNGNNSDLNMKYDEINASLAYDWLIVIPQWRRSEYSPGGIVNDVCNKTINIVKFVGKHFTPRDYSCGQSTQYIDLINYVNTLMSNPDIDSIENEKKRLELDNQLKDTQLKELTQKLKEQDDKLIELTQKLNEKDFKLKKLEDKIKKLENDLIYDWSSGLGRTKSSSNRFKELELQLKEKDNKLTELEDKIKDLEDDLIYFTSSKKKDDIITNLELSNQLKDTQLKEFTKKLEEFTKKLEEKEDKIEHLEFTYGLRYYCDEDEEFSDFGEEE